MKEIWIPILGFKNYEVSNLGRVMSFKCHRQMLLKPTLNAYGYRRVYLPYKDSQKCIGVASLVLLTFVGPRPENMTVSHLDGNRTNDRLDNLKYKTQKDNLNRREEHGTLRFAQGN